MACVCGEAGQGQGLGMGGGLEEGYGWKNSCWMGGEGVSLE